MIDVHPPHETAHSWRDFFIHIATIVVGLCIAVGLEQTVEFFHHRREIKETRQRIHDEVEVNQRILRNDQQQTDEIITRMNRNLSILHELGGKQPHSVEALDFRWNLQGFYNAAYNSARDSGTLSLMPYDESAMYSDAYGQGEISTEAMTDLLKQIYAAKAILHGRQTADLVPPEIEPLVAATSAALGKAEYLQMDLNEQQQEWDALLSGRFRNDIGGTAN